MVLFLLGFPEVLLMTSLSLTTLARQFGSRFFEKVSISDSPALRRMEYVKESNT